MSSHSRSGSCDDVNYAACADYEKPLGYPRRYVAGTSSDPDYVHKMLEKRDAQIQANGGTITIYATPTPSDVPTGETAKVAQCDKDEADDATISDAMIDALDAFRSQLANASKYVHEMSDSSRSLYHSLRVHANDIREIGKISDRIRGVLADPNSKEAEQFRSRAVNAEVCKFSAVIDAFGKDGMNAIDSLAQACSELSKLQSVVHDQMLPVTVDLPKDMPAAAAAVTATPAAAAVDVPAVDKSSALASSAPSESDDDPIIPAYYDEDGGLVVDSRECKLVRRGSADEEPATSANNDKAKKSVKKPSISEWSEETLANEGITLVKKPPAHGVVATFRTNVNETYTDGWKVYLDAITEGKPWLYVLNYVFVFETIGEIIIRRISAYYVAKDRYAVTCEHQDDRCHGLIEFDSKHDSSFYVASENAKRATYRIYAVEGRPSSGYIVVRNANKSQLWQLRSSTMRVIRVI